MGQDSDLSGHKACDASKLGESAPTLAPPRSANETFTATVLKCVEVAEVIGNPQGDRVGQCRVRLAFDGASYLHWKSASSPGSVDGMSPGDVRPRLTCMELTISDLEAAELFEVGRLYILDLNAFAWKRA